MPVPDWIKRAAVRLLPEPVLRPVKRFHYARIVRRAGLADEPELLVVRHLLREGDVAIDIGASIGIYTKALSAMVGPRGLVFAIEPVPDTHEILRRNVATLGLKNVRLMARAISDGEGSTLMEIPRLSMGEGHYFARIVPDTVPGGSSTWLTVRTTTLDRDFLPLAGRVAFVKCDVEGHEGAVVAGAHAFLAASPAAWLMEVSGDLDVDGSPASLLVGEMARFGLSPWLLRDGRLRPRRPGDRSVNYLFLGTSHLVALRQRAPELFAAEAPVSLPTPGAAAPVREGRD